MKTLSYAFAAIASLVCTGGAMAQGQMMQGGMWGLGWMGGYGSAGGAILLFAVVAVLVVWIVQRKGK